MSQCEYGVCSLSMLSALSVIADDGWFYEFADKPVTVFYVEFYWTRFANGYDQYWNAITLEELLLLTPRKW